LKSRGLKKVSVVRSDDLLGISNAILESQLDGVAIQKCITHGARNTINRMFTKYKAEVTYD
jgi:transposase-like protein